MAKQDGFLARSEWWRFDRYEIVGGTHVAPAEGATLEQFDPFDAYRSSWAGKKRKGAEPPYVRLARLATAGPEEWLKWCREYGLLGILHEQTLEVRFWPHWTLDESEGAEENTDPVVAQKYWQLRGGGVPTERQVPTDHGRTRFTRHLAAPGMAVAEDDVAELRGYTPWHGRGITQPGVTLADREKAIQVTSVTEGYGKFFPRREGASGWVDRPLEQRLMGNLADPPPRRLERQEYPFPNTEAFRREYGEPLVLLRRWALDLLQMLEFWEKADSKANLDDLLSETDRDDRRVYDRFRAGLDSVQPAAEPQATNDELTWNWRWDARSLYGLLHVMMLEDFALKKRTVKRCAKCKTPYTTDNARQKYCTDQCQKAAQQARYRKKKRNGAT